LNISKAIQVAVLYNWRQLILQRSFTLKLCGNYSGFAQ